MLIWIIDEEWKDYDVEKEVLEAKYPGVEIRHSTYDYEKDLKEFGYRADGILAQVYASIPKSTIDRLENCKGIAVYGGGYDRIDVAAARTKNISVTNISGYCAEDLADYVVAAMYFVNKGLAFYSRTVVEDVKAGKWGAMAALSPVHRLENQTLGIVGLGVIGKTVAKRAQALGIHVIAFDDFVDKKTMSNLGVEKVSWEDIFKRSDYISVHLKGCDENTDKIDAADGAEVIDVTGLVVAPGFIDTHSHSDLQILVDPEVRPKVMQGITTEILGQDGISMAPLPEKYISPWRKNLAGLDGDSDQVNYHYRDTAGYLKMIDDVKPGPNECYLVPHGNVRMEAMGLDNRQPTDEELQKMKDIVRREMENGAIGLSTGLIYMPCAYGQTKEVVEMCKVVAEYDGRFVIHQRSEADTILDSMKEVIQIGKESGVKIHYSHFKVCGRKNWDKIDGMIQLLEEAEKEGIDVSFDQYPYVAGSTMLGVILPPWVHDGGTNKVIERLNDPELRKKMVYDIEHGIPGWDNFVDFAGLDQIYVTSVKTDKNKDAVGLSLTELGKLRGKDPYDATFDLLRDEENAVGMVDFYGTEDHVKLFMKRPEMNVCTDGLLGGKPHPRVYGAFPRVLGKYVREDKALTLEQAVYKMTGKPAATFNIKNRGQIKEGAYADITVFNPDTVIDKGTFTDPTQYPEGIEYVMVNGVFEVAGGKYTGRRNGTVLRKKGKEVVK